MAKMGKCNAGYPKRRRYPMPALPTARVRRAAFANSIMTGCWQPNSLERLDVLPISSTLNALHAIGLQFGSEQDERLEKIHFRRRAARVHHRNGRLGHDHGRDGGFLDGVAVTRLSAPNRFGALVSAPCDAFARS